MSGKGIHKAFDLPIKDSHYYEDAHKAKARARQFDEAMASGKEDALKFRAAMREVAKRRASAR